MGDVHKIGNLNKRMKFLRYFFKQKVVRKTLLVFDVKRVCGGTIQGLIRVFDCKLLVAGVSLERRDLLNS